MKIERLLKILFYILNRNCVTTTTLAKEFGVSRRTILRDIDTLTLAGIPIYSEIGSKGGYSIHSDYKVNEKIIDDTNSEYIVLALKSLKDIYGDKKVEETYEKVKHIFSQQSEESMLEIDLSVVSENADTIKTISTIKKSIQEQQCVSFEYTNSQGKSSNVEADILHVFYKWYSWYMFAYNRVAEKFFMYKIVRTRNLILCESKWLKQYDIENELQKYDTLRNDTNISIRIEYQKEMLPLVEEYFPNSSSTKTGNTIISEFKMKENDFVLFSILLGFGSKLKVLSPLSFRQKIEHHLEDALKNYKNGDI